MAGLIYYDTNNYTSWTDLLAALKTIPNFWDEIGETTLTKGGVTISLGSSKTISGYGETITLATGGGFQRTIGAIAATNNGLVFEYTALYYGAAHPYWCAIGSDRNGNWGALYRDGSENTALGIDNLIADNVTSTTFGGGSTYTSNVNTQIIDIAADKGNFIFEDLRRILYAASDVASYNGRLTMPNGEKYVKCGAFALRYTD